MLISGLLFRCGHLSQNFWPLTMQETVGLNVETSHGGAGPGCGTGLC